MEIIQKPTSDFTAGRRGKTLKYIVMHWGDTSRIEQIDYEVANPNRQMSYHYALSDLKIHQYVSEDNTAWHASVFDINCESIGICINASPTNPYTDQDYETASWLIADIFKRRGRLEIKGHRDFKATQCPGNLDFARLNTRVSELLNGKPVNQWGTVNQISTNLNIRSCPSTDCSIVGKKQSGNRLFLISETNGWYQISEGWVYGNYITKDINEPTVSIPGVPDSVKPDIPVVDNVPPPNDPAPTPAEPTVTEPEKPSTEVPVVEQVENAPTEIVEPNKRWWEALIELIIKFFRR